MTQTGAPHIEGKAAFETEVVQSKLPVLVDFYAEWCGPCKLAAPIMDRLSTELKDKVKIVKIDVDADDNRELSQQFGVMSIPTVMTFRDGQMVEKKIGFIGEDGYRQMITKASA